MNRTLNALSVRNKTIPHVLFGVSSVLLVLARVVGLAAALTAAFTVRKESPS